MTASGIDHFTLQHVSYGTRFHTRSPEVDDLQSAPAHQKPKSCVAVAATLVDVFL